eukprot:12368923-Alexandrium_andersonii.AAC.1
MGDSGDESDDLLQMLAPPPPQLGGQLAVREPVQPLPLALGPPPAAPKATAADRQWAAKMGMPGPSQRTPAQHEALCRVMRSARACQTSAKQAQAANDKLAAVETEQDEGKAGSTKSRLAIAAAETANIA